MQVDQDAGKLASGGVMSSGSFRLRAEKTVTTLMVVVLGLGRTGLVGRECFAGRTTDALRSDPRGPGLALALARCLALLPLPAFSRRSTRSSVLYRAVN